VPDGYGCDIVIPIIKKKLMVFIFYLIITEA